MKWIFAIVALTAILAAGLHLSENVSRFDAPGPSPKTTVIPSPPVRLSKMTFPISVPIAKEWAPVGDTITFTARVLNGEGEEIDGASVTWSSSNTNVATVDANGVVTAVAEGTAHCNRY